MTYSSDLAELVRREAALQGISGAVRRLEGFLGGGWVVEVPDNPAFGRFRCTDATRILWESASGSATEWLATVADLRRKLAEISPSSRVSMSQAVASDTGGEAYLGALEEIYRLRSAFAYEANLLDTAGLGRWGQRGNHLKAQRIRMSATARGDHGEAYASTGYLYESHRRKDEGYPARITRQDWERDRGYST